MRLGRISWTVDCPSSVREVAGSRSKQTAFKMGLVASSLDIQYRDDRTSDRSDEILNRGLVLRVYWPKVFVNHQYRQATDIIPIMK